ncbi:MAG: STN domain-containing protein, partial [Xanthomonas sp.]
MSSLILAAAQAAVARAWSRVGNVAHGIIRASAGGRRAVRGLRRLIICGSLALQLVSWNRALAVPLASDTRQIAFSIPAQALSTALIAYGKQANVQVLTASPTLGGLRSDGLQGAFTADAALQRLLQSSGLAYRVLDANTVAVTPAAPAPV